MSRSPRILFVHSQASDRTLATLLLQRDWPEVEVTPIADPLTLVDALSDGDADVAVVAADVAWAGVRELVALLKRRRPRTPVVLFGDAADLGAASDPGLACEGWIRRSSAGLLALGDIVREVIERSGRAARPGQVPAPPALVRPDRSGPGAPDVALMVSHDVREPLQQIIRLARRIQAEPDAAAGALQQVLQCAERAGGMLDRLIEYLAVTARDATPAPVDLNACLDEAIENLRSSVDESGAEIRAVSLPTSLGDAHQIVHLFQNLLSNAIKFRGPDRPVITISVEPRGDQWLLAFRDNGIGIPPAFTERIFELGRRLHTRDEYPGSGIGLALCRRIAERHGGRIWGESREGGGSTFFVLLPRAPADVARLA